MCCGCVDISFPKVIRANLDLKYKALSADSVLYQIKAALTKFSPTHPCLLSDIAKPVFMVGRFVLVCVFDNKVGAILAQNMAPIGVCVCAGVGGMMSLYIAYSYQYHPICFNYLKGIISGNIPSVLSIRLSRKLICKENK